MTDKIKPSLPPIVSISIYKTKAFKPIITNELKNMKGK